MPSRAGLHFLLFFSEYICVRRTSVCSQYPCALGSRRRASKPSAMRRCSAMITGAVKPKGRKVTAVSPQLWTKFVWKTLAQHGGLLRGWSARGKRGTLDVLPPVSCIRTIHGTPLNKIVDEVSKPGRKQGKKALKPAEGGALAGWRGQAQRHEPQGLQVFTWHELV